MLKLLSNLKIRTRMAFGAGLGVLLLGSAGLFSLAVSSRYLEASYGTSMIALAEAILNEVDRNVGGRREELAIFATQTIVRRALEASNQRSGDGMVDPTVRCPSSREIHAPEEVATPPEPLAKELDEEINNHFIHFYLRENGHKLFEEVVVADIRGRPLAGTVASGPVTYEQEEWWQKAIHEDRYRGMPEYEPGVEDYLLTLATRVTDFQRRVVGVVMARLYVRWVLREAEIAIKREGAREIRLTTNDGRLLYSTKPYRFFENVSDRPFFRRWVSQGKDRGYFVVEEGARDKLFSYALARHQRNLESMNWILFVARDRNEVMAPMFILRNSLLAGYGVVLILGIGAAVIVSRFITRPVMELHHAAAAVARGDLSSRISVASRDELGELGDAFNRMTAQLEQGRAALEREIAERKTAQEIMAEQSLILARQAGELERSNRELQDFAYIASHDLQEPLRKIMAFGERLESKEGAALSERGKDYLRRMRRSAMRLSEFIDDLLSYSRVTTKAKPFQPTDLGRVVGDVLETLEELISQSGARVEVGDLPVIDADAMQMHQLFQNLIANALKFQRADVQPTVTVSSRLVRGECSITVNDNGIGFDMKYLDRIFKPFQRLHGRGEYEGSGMGLAICQKIVDRHRGRLEAASREGFGTVFTVTLPVSQAGRSEAA